MFALRRYNSALSMFIGIFSLEFVKVAVVMASDYRAVKSKKGNSIDLMESRFLFCTFPTQKKGAERGAQTTKCLPSTSIHAFNILVPCHSRQRTIQCQNYMYLRLFPTLYKPARDVPFVYYKLGDICFFVFFFHA